MELSDSSKVEEQKTGVKGFRQTDTEFENFVPVLLEMARNATRTPSELTRISALQILANLSLKDNLRPQLVSHGATNFFLEIVRKMSPSLSSVEAQRLAAKGLVNLVSNRKDLRMQVVSELTEEIKMIYRNQLDAVVASYIQTLLH